MMRLLRLLSLSVFALTARAIHESDVGVVDWYTKLVGVPLYTSQLTKPVLHGDTIFTATTNNVLAALNITDGSISWRTIHGAQDAIMGFKVHDNKVYALSGPAGSTLSVYDASSGHLVHEKRLHNPVEAKKHDTPTLGIALSVVPTQGGARVVVLTNGDTVRIIDSRSAETVWQWTSEDQGSLVMYTHIYLDTHTSTLYVAGFAKSVRSYTLHVTTLDLDTGEVIASVNIPASITNALTDFLLLGPSQEEPSAVDPRSDATADVFGPSLVWLSPSSAASNSPLSIFSAPLSPSLKGKVLTVPDASYKRIQDVDLSRNGLFIAFQEDNVAHVLGYGTRGSPVGVVWDFSKGTPPTSTSPPHFVGVLNQKGNPCIGKVAWSYVHNQAIHHVFEANMQKGTGQMSGFTFPFDPNEHGTIGHVAFLPPSPDSSTNEAHGKLLLVTSTGSIQLWDRNVLQWVREESLATVQTATFVEFPPTKDKVIGGLGVDGRSEGFWRKIARQIGDTKNLPRYIIHFATRFVTGSYTSLSSPISLTSPDFATSTLPYFVPSYSSLSSETPTHDPFSFRQLVITSTPYGKLFALDTSTGAIVWSRILGLGWAREVGGRIVPVEAFPVRRTGLGMESTVLESRDGIALVTQRVADNTLVDTVIFHFDPLTGEDIKHVNSTSGKTENHRVNVKGPDGRWITPLEGVDVIAGPMIDAFLVPDSNDTVGILDEFLQVQLYPDTPATRSSLTRLAPHMHFALRAGTQLLGHQLALNAELSFFHVAFPTWGVSFGEDETITIVKSPHKGREVASLGRVKGDRSTLYKYLNPHMTVMISTPSRASSSPSHTCGLYVIDTVKGTMLYHVSLPLVDGKCDIQATLDENWLVYSYYDDTEVGGAKGYRIVSVEMYEGYGPDEKISSSDITSYSNKTTEFSVYEQAFVVPHGVTAIATTATKFGVSTKDIIISTRKNSVHSIPRRLLNPRRPRGKPTSEEAEEMLVQYDPILSDDGRLVLSHYYEVADVRQIVAAPSQLESTSLVLALGTDLFLTRVAPSGTFDVLSENFNKLQLVLTVVGLVVAITVTRPMVRRKKLRERWYQ